MARAISPLPVPVSPRMQNRSIAGGDDGNLIQHLLQSRALANDLLKMKLGAGFTFQMALILLQSAPQPFDLAGGPRVLQSDRELGGDLVQKRQVVES